MDKTPTIKLPERIKAARTAAGMTSEQLAEALGVTRAYISQIENGKRHNVTPCFLNTAAWVLRVSPMYILGRDAAPMFELLVQWFQAGWLPDWFYDRFDELVIEVGCAKGVTMEQAEKRTQALGLGPIRPTRLFKRPETPQVYYTKCDPLPEQEE